MLEVFLCCARADGEIAEAVAARLIRNAEVEVAIDDSSAESVAARWEGGLSSAAILLLLSPEAVPALVSRAEWQAVLDHLTGRANLPLGCLFVRDCGYPRLLERRNFFRWDAGAREALRAVEEWVMRLHRLPEQRSFTAARLPWFEGRQDELDLLWETLVDGAGNCVVLHGDAASGKTSLAQQFARQAGAHFRDEMWVACGDRSPAAIAADLAEQLGEECKGASDEAFAGLAHVAGRHRVLLVFDDFPPDLAVPADPEGRASVLITTRSAQEQAAPAARVVRIPSVPEVPLEIPEDPAGLRLWQAMAVCHPSGFPLELAAQIARLEPGDVPAACARLIQCRLADPFDDAGTHLRLSALSAAAAGESPEMRRRHAEAVHAAVSQWTKCPDVCHRYGAELMAAFRWGVDADWPLATGLARHAFAFLRSRGRVGEAAEFLVALRDAADLRSDWRVSDECSWELSWIRGVHYRGGDRAPVRGDQLSFDFAG